jgi:FHA domain
MIEPLLQDYIDAAAHMSRDTFCAQFKAPVLVTLGNLDEGSFQMARTFFIHKDLESSAAHAANPLNHQAKVLEVRQVHSTTPGEVKIGRAEENDIVLVEETISAHHAVIQIDERSGQCALQDLESTNGTWINRSVLVPGRYTALHDSDVLSFGEIDFLFYYPEGLYNVLKMAFRL